MKKIIALLAAVAVFSTSLFALPGSMPVSLDKADLSAQSGEVFSNLAEEDALFANVQATALTAEEAQAVEGDRPIFGWISVAFAVIGITSDLVTQNYKLVGVHAAVWAASTVLLTVLPLP